MRDTYFGIGVGDSCNNVIFNNFLTNNGNGISVTSGSVINCSAKSNTGYGISGNSSTITHCNVVNNGYGIKANTGRYDKYLPEEELIKDMPCQ